ncbi:FabA-like domain protein [Bacillus sp. SM2101]|uniref:3-hydroxyacyl-ACP dehydratase FabZ family protein n=1 Tax=Bacillus sp. SM2101 TaxID=2805366 RepID=UPI001BDF1FC6|nr:FabA-like domain protein [Bacillus sp. SM2101]
MPHQYPLRLIDRVDKYVPKELLRATLDIKQLDWLNTKIVPYSVLLEGMAQAAVIFIQLETRPLKENEVPVLGAIKSEILSKSLPSKGKVSYDVKPLRILETQAVLEGIIKVDNQLILKGTLTVGVQS